MPLAAKWMLTCLVLFMAFWMSTFGRPNFRWLVDEEKWRGGRLDPMRWFLFEKSGDLRIGGVLAIHAAMLGLLWI